jgi:hypothetical protein
MPNSANFSYISAKWKQSFFLCWLTDSFVLSHLGKISNKEIIGCLGSTLVYILAKKIPCFLISSDILIYILLSY